MNIQPGFLQLAWIIAAGLLGFSISRIFSGWLRLSRRIYLIPYIGLSGWFLYTYVRWSRFNVANALLHNWAWGILAAVLLGVFVVKNVRSQPTSSRSTGFTLVVDLLWLGVAYGSMDALLLSVLPVLAIWQAFTLPGWSSTWTGTILAGVLAIAASIAVTVVYHLGYAEYRRGNVIGPVIGNTAMTLGYVLTGNPLAAILSHIAMHIAGVLHGPASVIQLPPHSNREF